MYEVYPVYLQEKEATHKLERENTSSRKEDGRRAKEEKVCHDMDGKLE